MRKYSRKHGWMILAAYSPGDGSISFNWVSDQSPNGEVLDEHVTESDISEWMMEMGHSYGGWEIVNLSAKSSPFGPLRYRIYQSVTRPTHTSKKLRLGGEVYEYETNLEEGHHFTVGNTTFYPQTKSGRRSSKPVENIGMCLALCFFLNHEEVIQANGIETRER